METAWKVSPNAEYGHPGELAYKLDTLVINRLIDEHHPDIPEVIKIADSLRELSELTNAAWTSYLVSARTIEVPAFTRAETRLLLTEPLKYSTLWPRESPKRPRFDAGFWGDGGIERIHAEAGGWPHLVQLIAETIVDLVNEDETDRVTPTLMDRALDKAIVRGHNVLYELLHRESALAGEWDYISGFRRTETQSPPDDERIAVSLRRRTLIEEENGHWRLRVPLMERWLKVRGL